SVQRALQGKHDQVYCFLDGVDQAHFRPAQPPPEPPQQAGLPHPRLGYFGSLDRRLDRELLAALAAAHPDWQLVMIGPVTHLEDEEALPQAPNIQYPGPEKLGDLPAFMSHWDVCILPWVCNEATRWASPVRLLEFLATEKPVVSTPIAGLTDQLTPLLYLADSPEAFVRACEQALVETAEAREQRLTGVRQVLEEGRWERPVPRMRQLLQQAVAQNRQRRTRRPAVSTPIPAATRRTSAGSPPVVILGAGPTGLSAAYHLGEQSLLLEQRSQVGGNCRSLEDHGFTFDYGGHVLFSKHPDVQQLYQLVLGDNLH